MTNDFEGCATVSLRTYPTPLRFCHTSVTGMTALPALLSLASQELRAAQLPSTCGAQCTPMPSLIKGLNMASADQTTELRLSAQKTIIAQIFSRMSSAMQCEDSYRTPRRTMVCEDNSSYQCLLVHDLYSAVIVLGRQWLA